MTVLPHEDPAHPTSPGSSELAEEVRQLRAERDALAAQLATTRKRERRGGVARRIITGTLVALFAILLPLTATMAWVHRTVLNTDQYVKTVTPIAADPTVTASVSRQLTDQIYSALNPQQQIANVLPPRASFLAGPIAGGVKSFVQDQVNNLLNTQQFQQFWVTANRSAHQQLLDVLNGKSDVIVASNGQVVLNLVPLLNAALQNMEQVVSNVVGKNVQLPTLSGNELPAVACQKISTALNRPLPTTCGQIPLFPEDRLTNAQRAVRAFNRLVVALLIVVPLLFLAALWVSRRRRRTLIQLTVGAMLGLVVARRAVIWFQDQLIATAQPENTASRTIVVKQLLGGFFDLTRWLLIGALIVLVLSLLSGPYRWARALRHGVVVAARAVADLVASGARLGMSGIRGGVDKARDETVQVWIRSHLDALRIGGVVVAVVLLLLVNASFIAFLVIIALLAAYEFLLYRMRPQPGGEATSTEPSTPKSAPEADAATAETTEGEVPAQREDKVSAPAP